jgi:hypothetical protein
MSAVDADTAATPPQLCERESQLTVEVESLTDVAAVALEADHNIASLTSYV